MSVQTARAVAAAERHLRHTQARRRLGLGEPQDLTDARTALEAARIEHARDVARRRTGARS